MSIHVGSTRYTGFVQADSGFIADTVDEFTVDTGVTVDGVLLKDGLVDGVDVAVHAVRHTDGSDDIRNATNVLKGIARYVPSDFKVVSGQVFFALLDTDNSHRMSFDLNSDLTADRTLTFVPGDADRTITLSGNPTLADWFDQSVKVAANPAFQALSLNAAHGSNVITLGTGATAMKLRSTTNIGGSIVTFPAGTYTLAGLELVNNFTGGNNFLRVPVSMTVAQQIAHAGDANTLIEFSDDLILIQAGGSEFIRFKEQALGADEVVVNEGGVDIDFRVESRTNSSIFKMDAGAETLSLNGSLNYIGDGGVTNYIAVDNTGDLVFVGGAGLCYGEIYASDVATTIAIAAAGQANKVQITAFTVDGESNNMTPAHGDDHITVDKAGAYLCTCSIAVSTVGGGGADRFGFAVYKNNGATEFVNLHAHRQLSGGATDVGSVSLSGFIVLAVNDTIEAWVWNEDSTSDIVVDDVTLSLIQIGGT